MTSSDQSQNTKRCPAVRRDGNACTAVAGPSGICVGHRPGAEKARRKGGAGTSRAARAGKLMPARLRPVADALEAAIGEVHRGELDPRKAQAMASLAGALVKVITSGEMEERLRALEASQLGS